MTSNKHPFPSNKLPDRPFDAELAEWIRGAALGDQESQKKIYQRIAAQIVRIVRRIVGQDHVDDVVQDFFVTLFAKISQFRFESSFETWFTVWPSINPCNISAKQVASKNGYANMLEMRPCNPCRKMRAPRVKTQKCLRSR